MRPLYIEGTPACRVVLDQPALRIVIPEQSDRLFPLSRISKIVCNGVVDWSMSALLACADAGINLVFLQKNGEIRAHWLSHNGARHSLTQRVADLLVKPDGFQRYENWYCAMEKLAIRSFARQQGVSEWREISVVQMRKWLAGSLSSSMQLRANVLRSLLNSELVLWLNDCDFACHDEVVLTSSLNLADDLSKLLLWDCYDYLLSERFVSEMPPLSDMASLFQAREDRLFLLFKNIVNKFCQFLSTIH